MKRRLQVAGVSQIAKAFRFAAENFYLRCLFALPFFLYLDCNCLVASVLPAETFLRDYLRRLISCIFIESEGVCRRFGFGVSEIVHELCLEDAQSCQRV